MTDSGGLSGETMEAVPPPKKKQYKHFLKHNNLLY
jgi:hypothetical protein